MAKTIPAQCDVRTRGGKTTVTLTSAGAGTLERATTLCEELTNQAVPANVRETAKILSATSVELRRLPPAPAKP